MNSTLSRVKSETHSTGHAIPHNENRPVREMLAAGRKNSGAVPHRRLFAGRHRPVVENSENYAAGGLSTLPMTNTVAFLVGMLPHSTGAPLTVIVSPVPAIVSFWPVSESTVLAASRPLAS